MPTNEKECVGDGYYLEVSSVDHHGQVRFLGTCGKERGWHQTFFMPRRTKREAKNDARRELRYILSGGEIEK